VASTPIACPRETTDKRRTTTTNSSSSHHHDSAPSRPHPLMCTGAEPIHPVHCPRKLPAWPWPPETRSFFCHFGGFFLACMPQSTVSSYEMAMTVEQQQHHPTAAATPSNELTVLCGMQAWPSACKRLREILLEAFICYSMFPIHQMPHEIIGIS